LLRSSVYIRWTTYQTYFKRITVQWIKSENRLEDAIFLAYSCDRRFLYVRLIFFFSQIYQVCNVTNYFLVLKRYYLSVGWVDIFDGIWRFLSVTLIFSLVCGEKGVPNGRPWASYWAAQRMSEVRHRVLWGKRFFFHLYQAHKYVLTSWYFNSFFLSFFHSVPRGIIFY
jgi:hypothetical protein